MLTLKLRVVASACAAAIALSTVGLSAARADDYRHNNPNGAFNGSRYGDGHPHQQSRRTYNMTPQMYGVPPAYYGVLASKHRHHVEPYAHDYRGPFFVPNGLFGKHWHRHHHHHHHHDHR